VTTSPAEDWTHTAIVVALPPDGAGSDVIGTLEADVATVLSSPEFDEVSVHLVISTPGSEAPTFPTLESVLIKALGGTEAATISLVWCQHERVEDDTLARDLDALRAARAGSPLVEALQRGTPLARLAVALRETVIGALEAADGAEGIPRGTIEAVVSAFIAAPDSHVADTVRSSKDAPAPTPLRASPALPAEWPAEAPPLGSSTTHDRTGLQDNDPARRLPVEDQPRLSNTVDRIRPDGHIADPGEGSQISEMAAEPSQPFDPSPGWPPLVLRNAVTAVSAQYGEWRARSKVRRAEEQIGVSALELLPLVRGVERPLIYFALAASNDWDRRAVQTRDAALTLIGQALGQQWIAAAVNLGSSLARAAGPSSTELVAHVWKRVERSNDFDLGNAASELESQITRDISSLRLRGHEISSAHVVIFATEPPYVDSGAHKAYRTLVAGVQSVTWLLVGDSDWMEIPPELEEAPSRVFHAEQDGVALLLREVLGPYGGGPPTARSD